MFYILLILFGLLITEYCVFWPFLSCHIGLILLAVKTEETLLVTKMLHFSTPLHRLCQVPLDLTAVTARRLVDKQQKLVFYIWGGKNPKNKQKRLSKWTKRFKKNKIPVLCPHIKMKINNMVWFRM